MTALPHSLVRFEGELEQAIRRELGSRRRRRPVLRVALVGAAAAAVALGVLSAMPGNGQSVVARAAAVLSGSGDSIVHVVMVGRDVNADGATATWREESWQQTRAPFDHRSVRTSNGVRIDVVTRGNGTTEIYDETANTIYRGATPLPSESKVLIPRAKLSGAVPKKLEENAIESKQAIQKELGSIRSKVLAILQAGKIAEAGRTTVDGRPAVRLESDDESATILVDPQTYEPILWTTRSPDRSTTTVHFDVYESLPRTEAGDALFSLAAQHPGAKVDDSQADFEAASARLLRKR
jgi:hypothetical protein